MAKQVKIVLTANQIRARKAVETRKANQEARIEAERIEAERIASMTGAQKAAATKKASGADLLAARKAADTKAAKKLALQNSNGAIETIFHGPVASKPVATTTKPASPDLDMLSRLLALAPALKAAGLI